MKVYQRNNPDKIIVGVFQRAKRAEWWKRIQLIGLMIDMVLLTPQ